jgi:NAD(P)-dependent dehydrogenase (short-subunit alcohol dehydrogenase family)
MDNKVVVFSGATSGIGEVAAVALARQGARIVFVARNPDRAAATLAKLNAAGPGQVHRACYADLSLMAETRRVGAEIAAAEPRVDVLVNNAGAVFANRRVTAEGLELTFALNHMAYFVLTEALRANLAPTARIVSTSSNAHTAGRIDFDDLQSAKAYGGFRAYGTSKLCNILFTRELARRLRGSAITANCFHPGFVATNFAAEAGGFFFPNATKLLMKLVAISPEKGADTQIYLASSPEVAGVSGEYFYKRRAIKPSAAALNDDHAARLWAASAKLAGIAG